MVRNKKINKNKESKNIENKEKLPEIKEEYITKVIRINKSHSYEYQSALNEAADLITKGEVVVFPTETVYGLGANAFDPNAVKKIFVIKKRPADNPLIVHVSSIEMAKILTTNLNDEAQLLIKEFWPGPLTLILPKSIIVPDIVTAKLDTVAIRMPKNKIALDLINTVKVPIAAPSANLSGKPSVTKARYAYEDLNGKIPLILDGGESEIGIESTVINLTSSPPMILREGWITKEQIQNVLGKRIEVCKKNCDIPLSPGMKYKHYSPDAEIYIARRKDGRMKTIIDICQFAEQFEKKKIMIILCGGIPEKLKTQIGEIGHLVVFENEIKLARKIFNIFREADKMKIRKIVIEEIPKIGIGSAIMERIEKAADGNIPSFY